MTSSVLSLLRDYHLYSRILRKNSFLSAYCDYSYRIDRCRCICQMCECSGLIDDSVMVELAEDEYRCKILVGYIDKSLSINELLL